MDDDVLLKMLYNTSVNNECILLKNDKKIECVICYQGCGRKVVVQTRCNHFFHNACIKKWLKIKTNCPLCNTDLTKAL